MSERTRLISAQTLPALARRPGSPGPWTLALFGVDLPDNIGLTGKGLTGTLDWTGDHFRADGIPVTPFPDATPLVEHAYQQAMLELRDTDGVLLATSQPTIPVSVEIRCVSSGCHASEQAILNQHPNAGGFDPNQKPILCARCHADPALGTTGQGEAGYFSFRMHDQHTFIDEQFPGLDGCYKCHPGQNAQCLRGTMWNDHDMVCQDCHGNMRQVARSIEDGRVPWVEEPACASCHTAAFGEEPGKLYRQSKGHGGVMCEGCHHSTHAEWPSALAADNANAVALQGHPGVLSDCAVCHATIPDGVGPHGINPASVEEELLGGADVLHIYPNPASDGCTIESALPSAAEGRLLVFDAEGRTVRLLSAEPASGTVRAHFDGRDAAGRSLAPGVYFVRWQGAKHEAAGKWIVGR